MHPPDHEPFLRPSILSIGAVVPALQVSQEDSFRLSGYVDESIHRIFLNSGVDHRHFFFEHEPRTDETSDELNERYLRGALHIGYRAAQACLDAAGLSCRDVNPLAVCTSTGYVCPDIRSRLIACMGFLTRHSASVDAWLGVCG